MPTREGNASLRAIHRRCLKVSATAPASGGLAEVAMMWYWKLSEVAIDKWRETATSHWLAQASMTENLYPYRVGPALLRWWKILQFLEIPCGLSVLLINGQSQSIEARWAVASTNRHASTFSTSNQRLERLKLCFPKDRQDPPTHLAFEKALDPGIHHQVSMSVFFCWFSMMPIWVFEPKIGVKPPKSSICS